MSLFKTVPQKHAAQGFEDEKMTWPRGKVSTIIIYRSIKLLYLMGLIWSFWSWFRSRLLTWNSSLFNNCILIVTIHFSIELRNYKDWVYTAICDLLWKCTRSYLWTAKLIAKQIFLFTSVLANSRHANCTVWLMYFIFYTNRC